jgi:hypothetical protein
MDWFTTQEAAERLNLSSGRVRQLVSGLEVKGGLVRTIRGKNYVSQSFIDKFILKLPKSQSNEKHINTKEKEESPLNDPLEALEEGLHILSDGSKVQRYSESEYSQLERKLVMANELALVNARLEERANMLREQLQSAKEDKEHYRELIKKSLLALDNAHKHLTQRQFIEAKEKGLSNNN